MIVRMADERDYEACYSFANMVFQHAGNQISFEKAIPKVYAPDAGMTHIHRLVTEDDGSIRALIGVLPETIHTLAGDLKAGFVGSVSVHPDTRGQGYMKRLMADWEMIGRQKGLDLLVLGGQRQRYAYYGYGQGGQHWSFEISARCIRHALKDLDTDGISFREILSGSPQEAFCAGLHREGEAYIDRDWSGFARVCRSYHGIPMAAVDGDGLILGSIVVREKDPSSLMQAESVDDLAMDRMLKAWLTVNQLRNMHVTVSGWQTQRLKHLRTWAEGTSVSPSWMILVLNAPRVITTLMELKAMHAAIPDGDFSFSCSGEVFTIHVKGGHCTVTPGGSPAMSLSKGQLAGLLFDPLPGEDIPAGPAGWFPLPFSYTEPDEF